MDLESIWYSWGWYGHKPPKDPHWFPHWQRGLRDRVMGRPDASAPEFVTASEGEQDNG